MKRIPKLDECDEFLTLLSLVEQRIQNSPKKLFPCQVCVETLVKGNVVAMLKWCRADRSSLTRVLLDLQTIRFFSEDSVRLRTFGTENHKGKEKKPLVVTVPLIELFY